MEGMLPEVLPYTPGYATFSRYLTLVTGLGSLQPPFLIFPWLWSIDNLLHTCEASRVPWQAIRGCYPGVDPCPSVEQLVAKGTWLFASWDQAQRTRIGPVLALMGPLNLNLPPHASDLHMTLLTQPFSPHLPLVHLLTNL